MTDDHKALVARLRLLGDRATYEPHAHHQAADAIEALTAQIAEAEARHERELLSVATKALEEQHQAIDSALARASINVLNAPEDVRVSMLCEAHGYGAVMDAASRLWCRKDPRGAFYIGGCVGHRQDPAAIVAAVMEGE